MRAPLPNIFDIDEDSESASTTSSDIDSDSETDSSSGAQDDVEDDSTSSSTNTEADQPEREDPVDVKKLHQSVSSSNLPSMSRNALKSSIGSARASRDMSVGPNGLLLQRTGSLEFERVPRTASSEATNWKTTYRSKIHAPAPSSDKKFPQTKPRSRSRISMGTARNDEADLIPASPRSPRLGSARSSNTNSTDNILSSTSDKGTSTSLEKEDSVITST